MVTRARKFDSKFFDSLTRAQMRVVEDVSIGVDTGHDRKVLEDLVEMGVLATWTETLPGSLPVKVKRYYMPLHVHIPWCQFCSEKYGPTDK